jgi:hypothetical protein
MIGAHDFIAALPEGYDTSVGKRGGRLSAGQRQLVSFARAFLAAPAVLVLDEATSLLDIPSERQVQAALRTVLAGRTAVIIAHRLSTVAIADRVLVLDHGRITEDGTPGELMSGDGEYAALHASWAASLASAAYGLGQDEGSPGRRRSIRHRAEDVVEPGLPPVPGVRVIRVRYGVMRPGVTGRPKPSREAEQQYEADLALGNRRAELLDAAREAEARFREAQARHAPDAELHGPAEAFDAALTAAMRAAYAAQRAEIGPRGYDDRIYRRKAKATPRVRALTAEAEHLLTLRETHRLTGIPAVAFEPTP